LQRKVTCLWKEPGAAEPYRSALSLHGHTNHSKESLYFIVDYASRRPLLRRALAAQERRTHSKQITVDFWKGYWTPPLTPLAAYQVERNQIEKQLGLESMISLTDHDSIDAPMLLRVVPEARRIPVSLEWSVPFDSTTFHLGIHNLPSARSESIFADLHAFTKDPREPGLAPLLEMLHAMPEVLIVFNHPLWDHSGLGQEQHFHNLSRLMARHGMFVHAFELNGLRSWAENQAVLHLAEGWNLPVISGGDRHGCEAGSALNLTNAQSFSEFVEEVRNGQCSHVLFMPQYSEPGTLRILEQLLDVVRYYPDFPEGMQRWDERVFHPDSQGVVRPVSALWDKPPAFIELFFSAVRMLELNPVRRALQMALATPPHDMQFVLGDGREVAS